MSKNLSRNSKIELLFNTGKDSMKNFLEGVKIKTTNNYSSQQEYNMPSEFIALVFSA
jgi:hypothetical protein